LIDEKDMQAPPAPVAGPSPLQGFNLPWIKPVDTNPNVPQGPQQTPFGGFVGGLNQTVDNTVSGLRGIGIDAQPMVNSLQRAAQQRFDGNIPEGTRRYAAVSGALGLGDALVNFPLVGAQQIAGVPQANRVTSNMQQGFESLPDVAAAKAANPDFYNTYAGTAQALAPLPIRGGGLVAGAAGKLAGPLAAERAAQLLGTTGGRILDAGITQGAIQGINAAGEEAKTSKQINPATVAAGAIGGGLVGGAFEAAGPLAGKAAQAFAKRKKALEKMAAVMHPQTSGLERAVQNGLLNHLDGEDAAVARMMLGQGKHLEGHLSYPNYLDFSQPLHRAEGKEVPSVLPKISKLDPRLPKAIAKDVADNFGYPNYLDFSPIPKQEIETGLTRLERTRLGRTAKSILPPIPKITSVKGESRGILFTDWAGKKIKGYDRAGTGGPISALHPEIRADIQKLAEVNIQKVAAEKCYNDLAQALHKAGLGDKFQAFKIKVEKADRELNDQGQQILRLAREEASTGVTEKNAATLRVQPDDAARVMNEPIKPAQDITEADLLNAFNRRKNAVNAYKSLKKRVWEKVQQIYPNGEMPPTTAEVNYDGWKVPVHVGKLSASHEFVIPSERSKELTDLLNNLKADPATSYEKPEKAKLVKTTKSRSKAGQDLLGALTMAGDAAANADDGKDEQHKQHSHIMAAIGALIIGSGHLPAIKKALAAGAGKVAFVYSDVLDSARFFDQKLGLSGKHALENMILEHNALALQTQWGVHFDSQEQKAQALEMLRLGVVAPIEARAGAGRAAQVFGPMNQAQRDAVVQYYLLNKAIGKAVKNYTKFVGDKIGQQEYKFGNLAQATHYHALTQLSEALNPQGPKSQNLASVVMQKMLGNAMDGFFLLNPAHHLLNLTDSVLAGGSRTGPINMLKAWVYMHDPNVRSLFHDSSLFGSYRAEKNNMVQNASGSTPQPVHKEVDFKSDFFNANRVALASWYQYFQGNKKTLEAAGVTNHKDFVIKLLSNKLDPTTTMDAWVHMTEANMRTLGLDPLRSNPNKFKQFPGASLISFVSQPLRMARLVTEYAKEGRPDRISIFLGLTVLLGGQAAIPGTLKAAGEALDPADMAALKKGLNDFSLSGMVSNAFPGLKPIIPNVSNKLDYDPLLPIPFAGGSAAIPLETGKKLGSEVVDTVQAIRTGDAQKALEGAGKIAKAAATTVLPRVGPIPTGMAVKLGEAAISSAKGQYPMYFFNGDKQVAPGVTVPLHTPAERMMPFTAKLLPGQPELQYEANQNRIEAATRKKVEPKLRKQDLVFSDPLANMHSVPTSTAKKKDKRETQKMISDLLAGNH
jgi:hypothetical protein